MAAIGKSFDGTVDQTTLWAPTVTTGGAQKRGFPVFTDATTGAPEPFDPPDLMASGEVGSTVMGILGVKRHGKTATNMTFCTRLGMRTVNGRRLSISLNDHRRNNARPEYEKLCRFFGTEEILLSQYQLNILDQDLGLSYSEQLDMLKASFEHELGRKLGIEETKALRYGLKKVIKHFPKTAELGLLALCLRRLTTEDIGEFQGELQTDLQQRYHDDPELQKLLAIEARPTEGLADAAVRVADLIEELLDGAYGAMFGGKHSLASIMRNNHGLAAYDFSDLSDDAVTQIQSMFWRVKTSAMRRGDHTLYYDMELHDENYDMWRNLVYARAMHKFLKQIRATGTFVVMNTHRLSDYQTVGPEGSEQFKLATSMIEDIDMWLLGKHKPVAAEDTARRLDLSNDEKAKLLELERGTWGLKIGTRPVRWVRVELTDVELELSASDDASNENAIAA